MIKDKRIKKWGYLIGLFVLFVIAPFRVNALQELVVNGDDSISPGATVKYNIELNSDDLTTITNFSTDIYYESSVFTLTGVESGETWDCGEAGNIVSGGKVTCNNPGMIGNSTVATLVFKVNSTSTSNYSYITLRGTTYTYLDETQASAITQLEEITKDLSVKSSDATLADIRINDVSIEEFASDVYEYDINIDPTLDVASISATPNSSKAKFKTDMGNRDITLNYGSNVVDLVVISESGLEQLYRLNITREDTRSTDTTLSSLTVDGVSVENFRSNVYKYNVIKYKLGVLDIVGTPNDEKATVTVTPPTTIVPGDNNYIVTVTSENGNTANYTIIVNNVVDSINKKLKNLSVKGYDIDFDKNNNIYEISYNKTKFKDLHIYFTTVSNNDLVTAVLEPDINNDNDALSKLKPGDVITITVTGIDGESVEYTITITEDNRVNFFLVLELFLMAVIIIVVAIVLNNRKKNANKKKTTKTVAKNDDKTKTTKSTSKDTKPKKKKFSIFEEDDEEENEKEEDLEATKELSKEELNLK